MLAELMGHSQTRTTARYLHPQGEHLHEAIRKATGKVINSEKFPTGSVRVSS
jgi:hypothetical protein